MNTIKIRATVSQVYGEALDALTQGLSMWQAEKSGRDRLGDLSHVELVWLADRIGSTVDRSKRKDVIVYSIYKILIGAAVDGIVLTRVAGVPVAARVEKLREELPQLMSKLH